MVAAEEMFERTDHELAPWDIISGENKRLAGYKCWKRQSSVSSRAWLVGEWMCRRPTNWSWRALKRQRSHPLISADSQKILLIM